MPDDTVIPSFIGIIAALAMQTRGIYAKSGRIADCDAAFHLEEAAQQLRYADTRLAQLRTERNAAEAVMTKKARKIF